MKTVAIVLLMFSASAWCQMKSLVQEYPSATIREKQNLTVDGVTETWSLEWAARPEPNCGTDDAVSLACPCIGFAYGEMGDLYLTRLREGNAVERLRLTPLFVETPAAVVQRWPVNDDRDFDLSQRDDFEDIVSKREVTQVMNFADYNHDGKATEFYLQTEVEPCGKSVGVVIGISRYNPRLHVFGTVSQPGRPLYLKKQEWEALRVASSPLTVLDWPCYDHGAETETDVRLHWSGVGIDGSRLEYTCPTKGKRRELVSEKLLSEAGR